MREAIKESFSFFCHSFKHPKMVGAHCPTSRFLKRALVEDLDPSHGGGVIELGSGTGAVTKGLIEKGFKPEQIFTLEFSPFFIDIFKKKFPEVSVIEASAFEVESWREKVPFDKVQAVVSSLPLALFPADQNRILYETLLSADGIGAEKIVQFCYFGREPLGNGHGTMGSMQIEQLAFVWRNIYPAAVWRYRKIDDNNE